MREKSQSGKNGLGHFCGNWDQIICAFSSLVIGRYIYTVYTQTHLYIYGLVGICMCDSRFYTCVCMYTFEHTYKCVGSIHTYTNHTYISVCVCVCRRERHLATHIVKHLLYSRNRAKHWTLIKTRKTRKIPALSGRQTSE